MDDTKQLLRKVVNGQSLLKSELLSEIKKLDNKIDGVDGKLVKLEKKMDLGFKKVNERIDKVGMHVANLEDDAPTVEEFDKLEKRVTKVEQKVAAL